MVATLDLSSTFSDCSYTFAWVIQKLDANDPDFKERHRHSKITKVEYDEIKGKGYASRIYKVNLYFTDGEKPHCVILKVPNLKCMESISEQFDIDMGQTDDAGAEVQQIHRTECNVYRYFAEVPGLPIPKVFAVEDVELGVRDGAILMEFIADKGALKNHLEPYNEKQIKSLVKGLTKVMAASLEMDVSELKKLDNHFNTMEVIPTMAKSSAKKLVEKKPEYFEEPVKRIRHLIYKPSFMRYIHTKLNEELGTRPVIAHADLWTNNMFWKKNQDGGCSDELLALFDWQTAHCGTVSRDLSHILVVSTDTHLRKEIENEMCEYLYDCLKSEMNSKNLEMPFTLEQIKKCYRREFVRQTIMFIIYAVGLTAMKTGDASVEMEKMKENVFMRLKCALEDAISILETDIPKWLDENFVPKIVTQPRSRQSSLCKA